MASLSNQLGTRLAGRYDLQRELGKGGMATAYLAHDSSLDCPVVIKSPLATLLTDPVFTRRFQQEMRSLVKLSHPHIVKITDVGEHDGLPFFVMQYLAGGSLRDRQGSPKKPQPQDHLRSWLPKIAEALDFMHDRGYVHRDVKPANILFDEHGHAYLSDFGVAKAVQHEGETESSSSLTGTGMVLGTPDYLAPEIILGKKSDGRADQYALAITVYELLGGRCPFEGPTPSAVLVQQSATKPKLLKQLVPALADGLCNAVHQGLAKKPQERYATCRELADAVLAALSDQPSATVATALMKDGSFLDSIFFETLTPSPPGPSEITRAACPQCGKSLKLPTESAGRNVACPACQTRLTVSSDRRMLTAVGVASGSGEQRSAQLSGATPSATNAALMTKAWYHLPWARSHVFITVGFVLFGAMMGLAYILGGLPNTPPTNDPIQIAKGDGESKSDPVENTPQPVEKTPPPPAKAIPAPAQKADFVMTSVSQAMAAGDIGALWTALPPKYQADVTALKYDLVDKLDAEVWNKAFSLLPKLSDLLKSKKDIILASPITASFSPEAKDSLAINWDATVDLVDALAASELATLDGLKNVDPSRWTSLPGGASTVQAIKVVVAAVNEEVGEIIALDEIKFTLVSQEGDQATLREQSPGRPAMERDYTRIDGKWLPSKLVQEWENTIVAVKADRSIMMVPVEKRNAVIGLVISVEQLLDKLLLTKDQAEFDAEIETALVTLLPTLEGLRNGVPKIVSVPVPIVIPPKPVNVAPPKPAPPIVKAPVSKLSAPELAAAISAIEKAGGVVIRSGAGINDPPIAVHFHEQNFQNSVFLAITKLDTLELIDLENAPFTNAILTKLASLTTPTRIVLVGTRVERREAEEVASKNSNLTLIWDHSVEGKAAALLELRKRELTVEGLKQPTLQMLNGSQPSPNSPSYQASDNLDLDDWKRAVELFPDTKVVILYTNSNSPVSFSDREVEVVARLSQMERLDIGNAQLSTQGLRPLENHPSLVSLSFAARRYLTVLLTDLKTPVAISSPLVLKPLKDAPRLRELILGFPTDIQLGALRNAKNIESLHIQGENTDAGFEVISSMPNLKELRIIGSRITDKTMTVIGKLPQLRALTINSAPFVTDVGISKLAALRSLTELNVGGNGITREGFLKLLSQLEKAGNKFTKLRYKDEWFIGR